jgi:signal peptide peptidase SppA
MGDDYPDPRPPEPLYATSAAGVAMVSVAGPMMKGYSKYAECDTLRVREAVRAATASNDVRAILLVFDSPGGSVAGTQELADDVMAARQVKPVHAFADDCCCSAAYWVASQAERLTINSLGIAGSIGVFCVLEDTSQAAEMAGVKVHVISTGGMKGAAVDGTPITPAILADFQRLIDGTNAHFLAAVSRGRAPLTGDVLQAVATGQVWLGAEAVTLGLADAVGTMQQAHDSVAAEADRRARAKEALNLAGRGAMRISRTS